MRAFVVETALAAIAEAFDADGVVLTSRERSNPTPSGHYRYRDNFGDPVGAKPDDRAAGPRTSTETEQAPSVALRLPPSWGPSSPALFALYGNLWQMLTDDRHHCPQCGSSDRPLAYRQAKVDSYWAWFCRIDDQSVSVSAALVRANPFDAVESDALARSMASVVTAVSSPAETMESHSLRTRLSADVTISADVSGGDPANAITAEVTVHDGPHPSRVGGVARTPRLATSGPFGSFVSLDHPVDAGSPASPFPVPGGSIVNPTSLASLTATGRGPDIETAVARAAANACHPQCKVRFAGSSDLDGHTIAVVIVSDEDGSPRLGVSVRPMGDYSGVAEAVFLAASSGGLPRPG